MTRKAPDFHFFIPPPAAGVTDAGGGLSSDGPSWNGEVFAIGVASGPKSSPPRWHGTRVDRTMQAAPRPRPHFRLQVSGSARWSQRQVTLVDESIGQQHLHTQFRGG